jgi:hypothetical protein
MRREERRWRGREGKAGKLQEGRKADSAGRWCSWVEVLQEVWKWGMEEGERSMMV